MFLKKIKIEKLFFPIIIIAVLFLAPAHFVWAADGLTGWLVGDMGRNIFAGFVSVLFELIGQGIAILAKFLNLVLKLEIFTDSANAPVVYQSWTIMRDFANMFFIIALIIMAFATIFDIAKYSVKALIAKFLIAALLINFSLTLGGLVINGAQILNNTFLTAIGDVGLRLGQAVNPTVLLPSGAESGLAAGGITLLYLIMGLILGGVYFIGVLIATVFALIRIPMVWFLLIVSPLVWIASVFPQGDSYFKNWWKQYIGWNLFLPVFLFFLYFGLFFMTNIGNTLSAISRGHEKEQLGIASASLQTIFTFVLSAIFLIGGVIVSFKVSFLSGTGAIKAAGWAKGTTLNALGKYTGISAMGRAAQMKFQQVQKEGLPGRVGQKLYGGEAGQERRTSAWAERFGVKGVDLQRQKDFVGRADKSYELIQQQYNTGKIDADGITSRAKQFKASDPQGYAFKKMLAKMGRLDDDSFTKTITELKDNPYASQDFIKTAKESNFASVKPTTLIRAAAGEGDYGKLGPSFLGSQREIYKHIQSNGKILSGKDFSYEHFEKGIGLFGGDSSTDGSAFVKEVGKIRPDMVVDYKMRTKEAIAKGRQDFGVATDEELRVKLFENYLTDVSAIANLPLIGVWKATDENKKEDMEKQKAFRTALTNRLSSGSTKARENFINNLENAIRVVPDKDRDAKQKILDEILGNDKVNKSQTEEPKTNTVDLRNK